MSHCIINTMSNFNKKSDVDTLKHFLDYPSISTGVLSNSTFNVKQYWTPINETTQTLKKTWIPKGKIVNIRVLGKHSYDVLNYPLEQLEGIKVNDTFEPIYNLDTEFINQQVQYFTEGDLASLEVYEHLQRDDSTNYTKQTVVITKVETEYKVISKLWYREVIALFQLENGEWIAGTHSVDSYVEFKDDKWYSAFLENSRLYCIQLNKTTIENAPMKVHIDNNKIYEENGEVYYDNPRNIDSIELPEWCRVNGNGSS